MSPFGVISSTLSRANDVVRLVMFSSLTTMTLICFAGCGFSTPTPSAKQMRNQFVISNRKFAAPPVYNRIREVRSPAPILSPKESPELPPLLLPPIRLTAADSTLEGVASALGRSMGYAHYCAPSISSRPMTIEANGDLDTLAKMIATQERISIVVDHDNRLVQFLAGRE
jgi:hypothetical protein